MVANDQPKRLRRSWFQRLRRMARGIWVVLPGILAVIAGILAIIAALINIHGRGRP
jgi:hypothetical protein